MPLDLKLVADSASVSPSVEESADAMSARASGVVLVTCWVGNRPWGMSVTAFASLSAQPPMVLASLGSDTASARAIAATQTFGVSILAADQVALARYGSAPGAAKFLEPFSNSRETVVRALSSQARLPTSTATYPRRSASRITLSSSGASALFGPRAAAHR